MSALGSSRIFSIRVEEGPPEAILLPDLRLLLKMVAAHGNGVAVIPEIESKIATLCDLGLRIDRRRQQPGGSESAVLMTSGADLHFDYIDAEPSTLRHSGNFKPAP
jgi:hypothetical protein